MDDYDKMGVIGGRRTAVSACIVLLCIIGFMCVVIYCAAFN